MQIMHSGHWMKGKERKQDRDLPLQVQETETGERKEGGRGERGRLTRQP